MNNKNNNNLATILITGLIGIILFIIMIFAGLFADPSTMFRIFR